MSGLKWLRIRLRLALLGPDGALRACGYRQTQPGDKRKSIPLMRRAAHVYVDERFDRLEGVVEGWKPAEPVRRRVVRFGREEA